MFSLYDYSAQAGYQISNKRSKNLTSPFFQTTANTGRRSRWTVPLPNLPKLPRMSSRSQERSRNTPEPEPGAGAKRTRDLRNKISFWKRRSASITDYDPQYRVTYLGNVLTGWAKGEKAFQYFNFTIHAIMF